MTTVLTARRPTWDKARGVLVSSTVAMTVGVWLSVAADHLPGSEPPGTEDVVDAVAMVAAGVLGLAVLRRGVAAGLGRALLTLSAVSAAVWLSAGLADVVTDGGPSPVAARLLTLFSGVLFIPAFALLVLGPLLLFPDGRLPGRRWRPVAWLAGAGVGVSMLATVLAPGPVDEDVPGLGVNPLGVPGLAGLVDTVSVAGLVALGVTFSAAVAAVVTRLVRSRGPRRRQMWWFLAGALPMVVLTVLDDGGLPQVVSAVLVFAALFGAMAWALLGPPGRAARHAV